MQYRLKTTPIEAMQYDESSTEALFAWSPELESGYAPTSGYLYIESELLMQPVRVMPGEWIVKMDGKFLKMGEAEFSGKYELIA